MNYAVVDLGLFVCSNCSGYHRQLHHKVKGLGVSNFDDKDVANLTKWGNKKGAKYWLANHTKT